ncbi:MAG: serine hydrolase [Candidatus Kapaibacterium sp.]|nr:MAG: serine hydrolase [Candidatus Kapabacteria bacterium]
MPIVLACLVLACVTLPAQQPLYFPPLAGSSWETVAPASLGWQTNRIDSLLAFLQQRNTKAFLVLHNGRIAIEHYFGTFTRDSLWYWASAGKSVTAFLVGMAQQDGSLSIHAPTATYLGSKWTSCSADQEQRITIWHQLTMTSGLDDGVANPDCTEPQCLVCRAEPGSRWAYHNAPYTLLSSVLEAATGKSFNTYFAQTLKARTGMTGLWIKSGDNIVLISNARSMARFGLLILNRGIWADDTLLSDTAYVRQMLTPSQSLNPSYGYLWWLNGQRAFMLPRAQYVFPGPLMPHAPPDMVAALGKNGQILNVVPSRGVIVVRMGEAPDTAAEVTTVFNDEMWQYLSGIIGQQTSSVAAELFWPAPNLDCFPNPFDQATTIRLSLPQREHVTLKVFDVLGREVATLANSMFDAGEHRIEVEATCWAPGMYRYQIITHHGILQRLMVVVK